MIFLADEGVDRQIVERLRVDGHQVAYAEMSPGIMDEVVLMESRSSANRSSLQGDKPQRRSADPLFQTKNMDHN